MCDRNGKDDCRCLTEILEVIVVLQRNAERKEECLDTCDRGFLGNGNCSFGFNTRPVQIFTCCENGNPWSMPISKTAADEPGQLRSSVFRCEKVDGCCATFRVLERNPEESEWPTRPYLATNSFFTMNLECCCCLKCLPDAHVECI